MFLKLSNLNSKNQKHSGETILEVLVAVFILSSVMIATFAVLGQAIKTNVDVRNRIIALNIAREGIEGVRNIRDTNWLKYSGDRRRKWLCLDSASTPDMCYPSNPNQQIFEVATPDYRLEFFDNGSLRRYFLESITTGALDLSATVNNAPYKLYQIPEGEDGEKHYTHDPNNGGTNYEVTPFYRHIDLQVMNPFSEETILPSFCNEIESTCNATSSAAECSCIRAKLKVTANVQWREGSDIKTVALETYLFDFFERDKY